MKREWDKVTLRRIAWVKTLEVPSEPFRFNTSGIVSDPSRFFTQLIRDIDQGPESPRARTGSIQQVLAQLEDVFVNGKIFALQKDRPSEVSQEGPEEVPFKQELFELGEDFGDDVPTA